ncbi:MAG: HAD-IIB family hydrolase, partial [Candidatus Omnitrophica bacterium]|nr:HAD-IIB family hydrolase [Candidatus Omnitrophota bacterium]
NIVATERKKPYQKLEFQDRKGSRIYPQANSQALQSIDNIRPNGLIVVGPGSLFTSILPSLALRGLTESLIKARLRGVEVIFIFNPNRNSELGYLGISSIVRVVEKTSGFKFEQIFSSVIINKVNKASEQLLNLIETHKARWASTNPSRRGKLIQGILMPEEGEAESLRSRGIKTYVEEFATIGELAALKEVGAESTSFIYDTEKLVFLFSLIRKVSRIKANPIFVADKDETLTLARKRMSLEMAQRISDILRMGGKFIIISGANFKRVKEEAIQILEEVLGDESGLLKDLYLALCNGTQMFRYDKTNKEFIPIYSLELTDFIGAAGKQKALDILEETMDKFAIERYPDKIQIEDLGSQITFRGPGKFIDDQERKLFDPNKQKRQSWAEYIKGRLLDEGLELEVVVAGTTAIDILPKGVNKGYGIDKIVETLGIPYTNMLFAGDSFGRDGNDWAAAVKLDLVINVGGEIEGPRPTLTAITSRKNGPEGLTEYLAIFHQVLINQAVIQSLASSEFSSSPLTNGASLREKFIDNQITPREFVSAVIQSLGRSQLSVPWDVARPEGVYRFGGMFVRNYYSVEEKDPYKNLIERRRISDIGLLKRAVKDERVVERFTEAIEELLSMPEILQWTSYEVLEVILEIIRLAALKDPDRELKDESRLNALSLLDKMSLLVESSPSPIEVALRICAIGNKQDFADPNMLYERSQPHYSAGNELDRNFNQDEFWARSDIEKLEARLSKGLLNIVYVFDNAGEDIYDFVLINELLKRGHRIILAAKSLPAANDTTKDDLSELVQNEKIRLLLGENSGRIKIIATGTIALGLDLARISEEFRQCWSEADLIILKGQGNYHAVRDYYPTKDCLFVLRVKWDEEVKDRRRTPPEKRYDNNVYVVEYLEAS